MKNIEMMREALAAIKANIAEIEKQYGENYVPQSLKTKRDDLRLQINSMEIEEQKINRAKDFRDRLVDRLGFSKIEGTSSAYRSDKRNRNKNDIVMLMTISEEGHICVHTHAAKTDLKILEINPDTCNYSGTDIFRMSIDELVVLYENYDMLDIIDIKYMMDRLAICLNNSRAARESKV